MRRTPSSSFHNTRLTTCPEAPARCAPRSVQIGLVVGGRIEVNDHLHIVHMDAPRSHVGCHHGVQLALHEVGEGLLTVLLWHSAVHGLGVHPQVVRLWATRSVPCLVEQNTNVRPVP